MKTHVTTYFLAWEEKALPRETMEQIERHLEECPACSRYFARMTAALHEGVSVPTLEPDPYLPARIRALATERPHRPVLVPVLRFSAASATLAVAIAIGVFLGRGLGSGTEHRTERTGDILSVYYSALSQQSTDTTSVETELFGAKERAQ